MRVPRHMQFRNFASVSRDKQVKAAAICPLSLVARLWVVLVEMSFSVRVHPAPFSPTPNRHAGIGLKMKSVGPGGSRFELVGLLDPQRKEHMMRCRSPKRGRRPSAPPPPGVGVGSGVAFCSGGLGSHSADGPGPPHGANSLPPSPLVFWFLVFGSYFCQFAPLGALLET